MPKTVKPSISLTFGEQSESHHGTEINGNGVAQHGFSVKDLVQLQLNLYKRKIDSIMATLNTSDFNGVDINAEDAQILIIPNGVNLFTNSDTASHDLLCEMMSLPWDKKTLMYGRVVNKRARYNLCFGETAQAPNYEIGRGTIIPYSSTPMLFTLRQSIENIIGPIAHNLNVEGNLYYDINKTGIGFHGDTERKIVIGVRLGYKIPFVFKWYYENKPISNPIKIYLNHGDIYIMSEKAVGHDWKKRTIPTLRHAAGAPKYTNLV